MTATPNAAIYCRVSSIRQEDGYSLADQERGCREYAERQGYRVVMAEQELADSTALSRPRLDAIREAGRRGEVERIIVYVQDRLGRGADIIAVTLYLLQASGVAAECVLEPFGDTALDKGLVAIRGMVSGMEKENIARRTQAGRRARARSGKLIPGYKVLYGYRWRDASKSAYDIDPETAPIVQRIFRELAAGRSYRGMALDLTRDGIPTPAGAPDWTDSTIRKLIRHPGYTGQAVAYGPLQRTKVRTPQDEMRWRDVPRQEGESIALPEGTIPPLITAAEAAAARSWATTNKKAATRNNRNPEAFLLRGGYARCAACGGPAHAVWKTARAGEDQRPVYIIGNGMGTHRRCPKTNMSARQLDAAIWSDITRRMTPEFIARQIARHRDQDTAAPELDATKQALADVAKKQANLARFAATIDDEATIAPLRAELSSLAQQRQRLEERRDALASQHAAWMEKGQLLADLDARCAIWRENMDRADYALKRRIIIALDIRVSLRPADCHPRYTVESDWSVALEEDEPTIVRTSTCPPPNRH